MDLIIPRHVAIIMDGNGRWAQNKGKIRLEGHRKGAANLERILEHCIKRGIRYLTVYAFSTENWKRPESEIKGLMELFSKFLDSKKKNMKKEGIRLLVTGTKEGVSEKLLKKISETEKFLEDGDKVKVSVRFRGREMGHTTIGREVLSNFAELTKEVGQIDRPARMEGRSMVMFLEQKKD